MRAWFAVSVSRQPPVSISGACRVSAPTVDTEPENREQGQMAQGDTFQTHHPHRQTGWCPSKQGVFRLQTCGFSVRCSWESSGIREKASVRRVKMSAQKPLELWPQCNHIAPMNEPETFTVREYKDAFCTRAAEVASGKTHRITKHGKPFLKVTPDNGRGNVSDAVQRILASQVKGRVDIKASIQEGRP